MTDQLGAPWEQEASAPASRPKLSPERAAWIALYCGSIGCNAAHTACRAAAALGYPNPEGYTFEAGLRPALEELEKVGCPDG